MPLRNLPIRRKLMVMLFATTGLVLALTCASFIGYQYVAYRDAARHSLVTLGRVIASNSTAALAFDNAADARTVLSALRAEKHITRAALYDAQGALFARYPGALPPGAFPRSPGHPGVRFEDGALIGYRIVRQGANGALGELYLRWSLAALHRQILLYSLIAAILTGFGVLIAYAISRPVRRQVSRPVLALADAARAVSDRRDYSVRVAKVGNDELGVLTDAFNHMLEQITADVAERGRARERLQGQLSRLDLLQRITRAIGERQDLASIFRVVIRHLEDNLPIDFGCILLADPEEDVLKVASVGTRGSAPEVALRETDKVPVDRDGLARCLRGDLMYEADIAPSLFEFPQRLARGGLRALVMAPLLGESHVFGVLVTARRAPGSFGSADCEFLRQLSEHVALAAHQAQLYDALQGAYEDLRQSQQSLLQQERLRALGQMASGVAHDINNAISPISLYADTLLETEVGLSKRARSYLAIIQQAIHDVSETVSRMREFYRPREAQLPDARVDLNGLARGVLELTRARWRDQPQERGAVIELRARLVEGGAFVLGAESEIRDALTNLIFNAVDAMPEGGVLSVTTGTTIMGGGQGESANAHLDNTSASARIAVSRGVWLEVSDTGIGMNEETRRRCLEPFFTTKGERGTGMGLAMVYGMAGRHGAEIEIDSEPGRGTAVRLVFPAVSEGAPASGKSNVDDRPPRPARILIVDDDPLIIQSLGETLRSDGHAVTVADGGQAGVDAFAAAFDRGKQFELVITDLGMPHVDGRRVAAAVKARSPGTPVILLTGWGQRLTADNEVPPHVDRVLNKPPRLRELRLALTEFLGRS